LTTFVFTDSDGAEHRFADEAHTMLTHAIEMTTGIWPSIEEHRIAAWRMMDVLAYRLAQEGHIEDRVGEEFWPESLHGYHENAVLWTDLCVWRFSDQTYDDGSTMERIFNELRNLLTDWMHYGARKWADIQASNGGGCAA
jgi:hypothetical protein